MKVGRNIAAFLLTIGLPGASALADVITVQNNSFETPTVTGLGNPFVTSWSTPGPVSTEFPPGSGNFVNTNCGNFINTPVGAQDHIDNVDGNQAAFVSALSGNEFNQTLGVNFEAGKSYTLTVGIGHNYGGGNPAFQPDPTAKMTLRIFYTDAQSVRHYLASTDVINSAATGLSATHLLDFSATTALLAANNAAVGSPLSISMISASPVANSGGFFDLDNVRVSSALPEPTSLSLVVIGTGALLARRRRMA